MSGACAGAVLGLSPLTRGKRRRHRCGFDNLGPIPADAGETSCLYSDAYGKRAYPR